MIFTRWTTDEGLQKLSTTQKKQTTQNTAQQNYPGSVAFYHTRPRDEVGLFYSCHKGQNHQPNTLLVWRCIVSKMWIGCVGNLQKQAPT